MSAATLRRPAVLEDGDRLLTGWGRTAPTRAHVRHPVDGAGVRSIIDQAGARGVIARGLGRSYGDAAQNAGGDVVATSGLPRILALDRQAATVTAEAGVPLSEIARATVPVGLALPVIPGTLQVTLGGAIASDVHGKNHHREGTFGDHVQSLVLEAANGERLTLSAESHPDEFWATVGGMGLTGVILQATLTLRRIESAWVSEDIERASDLEDAMARMSGTDDRYLYSVAWVDCLARGAHMGRAVLERGNRADTAELTPAARHSRPATPPKAPLAIPQGLPSGLLRPPALAAFNELYYRRAARHRHRLIPLYRFLCPLDVVREWNRLYGPRGFLQYQFVVPYGQEHVIRRAIEMLRGGDAPPVLAVLKRFGPEHGLLSFPMAGWTLAVDMRAGVPGLAATLDELDELVAAAGGRVYLAKDSRLRPELVEAMYPQLARWREVRGRLDPDGRMNSDLARRLGLTGSSA